MESEWSVPKGRRICSACERAFQPDETLWSALHLDGPQLVRVDRCPSCLESAGDPDAICRWKTNAPHPDKPKRARLDTEAAGDLLKRLVGDDDPAHRALCYVLAIGLVRRRKLKLTGSDPAPEPTEAELEAERVYVAALEARAAAQAEADAAADPASAMPIPQSEPMPEPDAAEADEVPSETEETPEGDRLPPRPPPRRTGFMLLTERESDELIRVAEMALSDVEIADVTGDIRELFAGEL